MLLPSVGSHARAKLAAICGRDRGRADEMAQKYGVEQVFTDYRQMLASGQLDAVIVATPDDLHYAMTMDALESGHHVLCEKPLAGNAADARAMYEKAEARGLKHMTLFTWRWMPHFQHVRNLVKEGYIGRPFDCRFQFICGYARDGSYTWRHDGRRANGVTGDLGSHMIDLARWMLGDMDRVSASLKSFVDRPGAGDEAPVPANDSSLLLVEFANGAHGLIQTSSVSHIADRFMQQRITLHGEEGSLEAVAYWGGPEARAVIRGARHDELMFQLLTEPEELWGDVDRSDVVPGLFVKQPVGARLFIDGILADRAVSPSFYDGYKAAAVVDAALESQETGRWVSL